MKRLLHFTKPLAIFILFLSITSGNALKAQPGYDDNISLQDFYDQLSPYGQWIDDPDYGYIWVPQVDDPDFRPYYTDGHWAMTEYGNMWVSDYEWGWAPFHYGRWAYTDDYGWFWIPDTEWGPAWVNWRSSDEYYGWAPMGPRVSVDLSIGGGYSCPDFWWTFIPQPYIYNSSWYDYYVPFYRNHSIINVSIVIGNTYRRNNFRYVCGPNAYDLRRRGISFTMYNIYDSRRPGRTFVRNNYVDVYRPNVINRGGNYRPARTMSRNEFGDRRRDYVNRGNNNRNNGFRNRDNRNFSPGNNNRFENRNNGNGFGRNNQPGNNAGRPQGNNNGNFGRRDNNFDRGTTSPGRDMRQQRNTGMNGNDQGRNFNNRDAGTSFPGREMRQQRNPGMNGYGQERNFNQNPNPGNRNAGNTQPGGFNRRSYNGPGNNPGNMNNRNFNNNSQPRNFNQPRQAPQNQGNSGGYSRPSGTERSNPGMNSQRNSFQRESRGGNGGNNQGNGRRGRG